MNAMERQGADKLITRLRHLVVCAVMLSYVQPAYADTRVQVSVPGQDSLKFLVSVSTHHADLHNGYSRVRFQDLLASNQSHRIDTGFYFTLSHYSAWSYHPDFLLASSRTEGRLDTMPAIEPQSWRAILDSAEKLPITGQGPTYARAVEQVRLYPANYLPALDRAGLSPEQGVLAYFEAFLERSGELAGLSGELSDAERNTALRLQGQAEQALSELERAVKICPRQGRVYGAIGDIYDAQGNKDLARQAYQHAARVAPGEVHYLLKLARFLQNEGQLDQALANLVKAIQSKPKPDLWVAVADVYRQRGERAKQMEALTQALELEPEQANVHFELGLAHKQHKEYQLAIEAFEKATLLDPAHKSAHKQLSAVVAMSLANKIGMEMS